ncbi:Tetratricopeptide repeat protein OS=Streptomyces griseomycini OX=66895 GN=FHS37_003109 PE=4 SV=1 [Streptomyces griseomycini]
MATSGTTTGSTATPIGTAAHHHVRFVVTRRPAVRVATANTMARNARSGGREPTARSTTTATAVPTTSRTASATPAPHGYVLVIIPRVARRRSRERMDTATVNSRLDGARCVDAGTRDRICEETAAALLAAGTVPSFEVRSADLRADPYFRCADRYWRSRFLHRPTARTAFECARWMADHVRDENWGEVAEQWALGNGFLNRGSVESAEQVAEAVGEAGTGPEAERIGFFLTLFQAGKLRANFCFDELHAFLEFSSPAAAAGSLRERPVFVALRSFAAFGSRTLTAAYACELLEQAWSAAGRTRHTVDICLNGLAFAAPFEGQGELLRDRAAEAVEAYPDDHMFHGRLAAGLHLCGQYDAALRSIDTALALLATSPTASLGVLQDQYLTKREAIREGRLQALRDAEQQRRWERQTAANTRVERSLHTSSVRAVEVVAVFTAAIAFAVGSLQVTLTGDLTLSDRLWLLAAQGVGLAVFALLVVGGTWLITRSHHGPDHREE